MVDCDSNLRRANIVTAWRLEDYKEAINGLEQAYFCGTALRLRSHDVHLEPLRLWEDAGLPASFQPIRTPQSNFATDPRGFTLNNPTGLNAPGDEVLSTIRRVASAGSPRDSK